MVKKEMSMSLSKVIIVTKSGEEIPLQETIDDERHKLKAEADNEHNSVYLNFSSREAMYDFARVLLHEAIFSRDGQLEFIPLEIDGKSEVVDGVRMDPKSARLFIFYPEIENTLNVKSGRIPL